MSENKDINLTVEAWTNILVERWRDKIDKLKINRTGNLYYSITSDILTSANKPKSVHFEFPYYGKFIDMGVGRGVTLVDVKSGSFYLSAGEGGHSRKPKPWYSRVFYGQFYKLVEILARKYAIMATATLKETLSK